MLELPSKRVGKTSGQNRRGDDRILRAAAPDTHLRPILRRDRQQYRLHPLAQGSRPRSVGPYPLIQAPAEDVAPILLATRVSCRKPVTIADPLVGRVRV